MTTWTTEDLAARFSEAALTARRLDGPRRPGQASVWTRIVAATPDANDDHRGPRVAPTTKAIDRLSECTRWLLWLHEEERHLIWLRAADIEWHIIGRRLGCNRVTAWRRWQRALHRMAIKLNAGESPPVVMSVAA